MGSDICILKSHPVLLMYSHYWELLAFRVNSKLPRTAFKVVRNLAPIYLSSFVSHCFPAAAHQLVKFLWLLPEKLRSKGLLVAKEVLRIRILFTVKNLEDKLQRQRWGKENTMSRYCSLKNVSSVNYSTSYLKQTFLLVSPFLIMKIQLYFPHAT